MNKHVKSMLLSVIVLESCCLVPRKCIQDGFLGAQFKIISEQTGNDLLFGSTRVYDSSQIKIYSLYGTDTLVYDYSLAPVSQHGDSALCVYFGLYRYDTVFMKFTNTDIDTLKLTYDLNDQSACCAPYHTLESILFNNRDVNYNDREVTVLKK